ncbi:MAG: outer membrane lipoprotein-sorting protein [Acidobacteria bacterium]|nr:outer membrane lipoprotein-sorting protein [Acidobacteriota bacterium]MCB9397308.1 outer membrane lipoprotein-sorting protein [Acidobacteriota bacterium]
MQYLFPILVGFLFNCSATQTPKPVAPSAQKSGPNVEDILDRAAAARLEGINQEDLKTVAMKGVIQMPQGMTAQFQALAKDGSKYNLSTEVAGMKVELISDGKDVYENNPMIGPRLLQGEELAYNLNEANFKRDINWRQNYTSYQLLGEESINGRSAYKILLTTKEGFEVTNFYDKENYQVLRADMVVKGEMGTIPTIMYFSNYENVNGLVMPKTTTTEVMSHKMVMQVQEVTVNGEIPDESFSIPAEMKQ